MNRFIKYSTASLATALLATSAFAQDQKDKGSKDKSEKSQEIVIRKKGGKSEKMTIVLDGDDVTINGKPVDEFKNDNVTVFKRERPLAMASPRIRRFQPIPGAPLPPGSFDRIMPAHANKAMLGVLTEKGDDGVKVTDVTKESGAEKAGLQKNDVITKVGSTEVKDPQDLIEAIGQLKPNDKVEITYKRDGKENKTTATLGENKSRAFSHNFNDRDFNFDFPGGVVPPMDNFDFDFNRRTKIGLQIQDMEDGKGVSVKDVDEDSPASKAGFKEGDVITHVNGKNVTTVDELRNELRDIQEGETIKFGYKRNGKNETVEIKIPKRLKSADL